MPPNRPPKPARRRQRLGILIGLCAGLLGPTTGCVTVYHPLSGLQSPVIVDPAMGNFHGLRMVVHCVPKDVLEGKSGVLCRQVKRLFENQGAEVKTVTSLHRSSEPDEFEDDDQPAPKAGETPTAAPKADLTVELTARHLHEHTDYTMWTLSMFTMTLAPGISENTFVQDVVIRDAQGSLLVRGELKGRIVRYFGFGYWATTKLLNLFVRDDDEAQTDEVLSKNLSMDLYRQLSQMVFNANMRRKVLGAAPYSPSTPAPAPAPVSLGSSSTSAPAKAAPLPPTDAGTSATPAAAAEPAETPGTNPQWPF